MPDASPVPPFHPPLAFRVGVTGTRALAPTVVPGIEAAVADVLDEIARICADVAKAAAAQAVYATTEPDGAVAVRRTILSPLAEGSDQLIARSAIARDFALSVPTPFPLAVYEADFGDNVAPFRELLAKAEGRVLEIDGARGPDHEWRSYEAVGRMVVRNCDLLIAVWDDKVPPKGRGGTRDTIHFALRNGLPVWWIHAAGKRRPALVTDLDELVKPREDGACYALGELVKTHLIPPLPPVGKPEGILEGLLAAASSLRSAVAHVQRDAHDPLRTFLADTDPPASRYWEAHGSMIRWLARGSGSYSGGDWKPQGFWFAVYAGPDRLSGAYAKRYRSAYVLIITLAAAALVASSLASAFGSLNWPICTLLMGGCELASLIMLLRLIVASHEGRWHDRWIGYRLLAELCRKQSALAALGWSLPIRQISRAATSGAAGTTWLVWYFEAVARAAPLTTGSLGGAMLDTVRREITATLVRDQIGYHESRAAQSERAATRLLRYGEACFFLTIIFVLLKLATVSGTIAQIAFGLLASVLPTIAAAIFAVRAYAELEVLADQSRAMAQTLKAVQTRLDAPGGDEPLASQELGRDLTQIAAAMLADVAGWAQLFRMKGIEAG